MLDRVPITVLADGVLMLGYYCHTRIEIIMSPETEIYD
jgi:hypothetical protein